MALLLKLLLILFWLKFLVATYNNDEYSTRNCDLLTNRRLHRKCLFKNANEEYGECVYNQIKDANSSADLIVQQCLDESRLKYILFTEHIDKWLVEYGSKLKCQNLNTVFIQEWQLDALNRNFQEIDDLCRFFDRTLPRLCKQLSICQKDMVKLMEAYIGGLLGVYKFTKFEIKENCPNITLSQELFKFDAQISGDMKLLENGIDCNQYL